MTTLGDLTSRLARKITDESNTAVSLVALREAVNYAINKWKTKDWWFNEYGQEITLSAGVATFSFPGTLTSLYVFDNNGVVITYEGSKWNVQKVASEIFDCEYGEETGMPTIWTMRNMTHYIHPTPDQDYIATIRGIKDYAAFATDGSDDTSTNDLLTYAEYVIENTALARIHGAERQDISMARLFEEYANADYINLMAFHGRKTISGQNIIHSVLI